VPNATTVRPITSFETPRAAASLEEYLTRTSAPQIRAISPMMNQRVVIATVEVKIQGLKRGGLL
jgi:exoribonuclease II